MWSSYPSDANYQSKEARGKEESIQNLESYLNEYFCEDQPDIIPSCSNDTKLHRCYR